MGHQQFFLLIFMLKLVLIFFKDTESTFILQKFWAVFLYTSRALFNSYKKLLLLTWYNFYTNRVFLAVTDNFIHRVATGKLKEFSNYRKSHGNSGKF